MLNVNYPSDLQLVILVGTLLVVFIVGSIAAYGLFKFNEARKRWRQQRARQRQYLPQPRFFDTVRRPRG